jgi:glycosyltransferase involved in cell wall biosynthesis
MLTNSKSSKLRIAFDQQVFLLQEYGGISRYLCSLASEFLNWPNVDARIFAPLHFNKNLGSLQKNIRSGLMLPTLHKKLVRPVAYTSKIIARREISFFKPDIIHETYYSEDDFITNGARKVLTVYDLIHERYPTLFINSEGTSRPKKIAANRADHVICISESTRRDLIEYCGVPDERTSVVYLGVDFDFMKTDTPHTNHHNRPYLLYVGARGGYKNFKRLISVYSKSLKIRNNFDLVCFGGGKLHADEIRMITDAGIRPEQVIHFGGGDNILAALYKQAHAFIYPSLYEGFGIPPLEAMAIGCPVICSNNSSLPEVVGDAAETFDPLDEESMQAAIENVIFSSERRNELIKTGLTHHLKFSWSRCAQETKIIYENLL